MQLRAKYPGGNPAILGELKKQRIKRKRAETRTFTGVLLDIRKGQRIQIKEGETETSIEQAASSTISAETWV